MKVLSEKQHTPEWFAARCGVPGASSFDKIVTTKGEASKQAEKYMWQLAGERVAGKSEETFKSAAMERGTIMEAEARETYEFITGNEVKETGFCVMESCLAGGS